MGLNIEDLLPHRGRMRLIDEIVSLNEKTSVARTTASTHWPLFDGRTISPIVFIELVAQTAGLSNNLGRLATKGRETDKKGWLVGIKRAQFFVDMVNPGDRITVCSENSFELENYREITGNARIGSDIACEVVLQLVEADVGPDDA